jgi:putative PIN family toxin of toxin-antitoxin system
MRVVLDTNVLLVSISRKSRFHPIFQAFEENRYDLYVTTDILIEYEEVIGDEMGTIAAQSVLNGFYLASNVHHIIKHYRWNLITTDPDDNKFVDCAVAGNVDYLVTNDRHFRVLKDLALPKVNVISIEAFYELLTGQAIDL